MFNVIVEAGASRQSRRFRVGTRPTTTTSRDSVIAFVHRAFQRRTSAHNPVYKNVYMIARSTSDWRSSPTILFQATVDHACILGIKLNYLTFIRPRNSPVLRLYISTKPSLDVEGLTVIVNRQLSIRRSSREQSVNKRHFPLHPCPRFLRNAHQEERHACNDPHPA